MRTQTLEMYKNIDNISTMSDNPLSFEQIQLQTLLNLSLVYITTCQSTWKFGYEKKQGSHYKRVPKKTVIGRLQLPRALHRPRCTPGAPIFCWNGTSSSAPKLLHGQALDHATLWPDKTLATHHLFDGGAVCSPSELDSHIPAHGQEKTKQIC